MRLATTTPLRAQRFLSAQVLSPMVWGLGLCALIAALVPLSLDHMRGMEQIAQLNRAIALEGRAPAAAAPARKVALRFAPPSSKPDLWHMPIQPGEISLTGQVIDDKDRGPHGERLDVPHGRQLWDWAK